MSAGRIHQLMLGGRSRSGLSQYKIQRSITIDVGGRRCLSSTANPNPPTSHTPPTTSQQPQILDERTLLSQLSPLKRIICLCPVPLGRTRLPWSGGDSSSHPEDETINLNFQSQPHMAQNVTQMQPLKVSKYRYGERFAIGVAVTDPYLTHAQPVHLGNCEDGELDRRFVAEIVPTFRCDGEFFF